MSLIRGVFKHVSITNAFDDELHQLFVKKYLDSDNGDRTELCRVLLGVDFRNPHYSTPTDQKITIKNFGVLISVLEELCEGSATSIDSVIHRSFVEELKEHVKEMNPTDNE